MGDKPVYIVCALVSLLALVSSYVIQLGLDAEKSSRSQVEGFMYLPDPRYIETASLGYDSLAADIIWLRTIQTLGNFELSGEEVEWCYKALDTLTSVDPYFVEAYESGGLIFTLNEDKVDLADKLLEKGVYYNPDVWQLKYYLGFNYYYFMNDYEKAAKYLTEAAEIEGSPSYLPYLASRVSVTAKRPEFALEFLQRMYEQVQDERMRESYLRRMNEIRTDIILQKLQEVLDAYVADTGRRPQRLRMLVSEGYLKRVPDDPSGGEFFIDVDGKIRSTSLKVDIGVFNNR